MRSINLKFNNPIKNHTSYQLLIFFLLFFSCLIVSNSQMVVWNPINSVRCGQIVATSTLMTSQDNTTNITDQTYPYMYAITGAANNQLRSGFSLASYQSWMTDTFSFNITAVSVTTTDITTRFNVLDNTFFSQAKIHFIVVWRTGNAFNAPLPASPPSVPATTENIEVIYGCYFTGQLLTGLGNRTFEYGGFQFSNVMNANQSSLVIRSVIAGMQLRNGVGMNNYIKLSTRLASNKGVYHNITVQNNNFLTYICVTTVIYEPFVNQNYQLSIIQTMDVDLTATSAGLASVPYMERFDGLHRLFFGVSEFNLSMSDTRYLNVEALNISLVSYYYEKNSAMNKVKYRLLFFASRICNDTNQYYEPRNYTCVVTCPTDSIETPATAVPPNNQIFCKPCHYSCATCTIGLDLNQCITCPPSTFRTVSGTTCPCDGGYVDVGVALCAVCNSTIVGCDICNSNTDCNTCEPTNFVKNPTTLLCDCKINTYICQSYCLPYPGCKTARPFNNTLICDICISQKNFIQNIIDFSCICVPGMFTDPTKTFCKDTCGDSIAPSGYCDDGNIVDGDGCSSTCKTEDGYQCITAKNATGYPGLSTCTLKTIVTVTYLYSRKVIDSDEFVTAFSISPTDLNLTATSFKNNVGTSIPYNGSITFDPVAYILYIQGTYTEDIEATSQVLNVTFYSMPFYADLIQYEFSPTGINAKLVINKYQSFNSIVIYIVSALAVIALLMAIFSAVVGLKLAGLELLLPLQIIYFTMSTVPQHSCYFQALSSLKFVNGYNALATYDYKRTYMQPKGIVGINFQGEFLLSTNVMIVIYVIVLIWLAVHQLRLKYKEHLLQKFLITNALALQNAEEGSDQEKKLNETNEDSNEARRNKRDIKLDEEENKYREDHHRSFKVFSFEVDRVYFIIYTILVNQTVFSYIILALSTSATIFYFSQELNILVCNFFFFILIGNIVFIFYDQQSNRMISFTCIQDRYAYVYFLLDFIIILVMSMLFNLSFCCYIITFLSIGFIVLIIKEKPYSSEFFELENMVALYNSFMLTTCLIFISIINSSSDLNQSIEMTLCYLMILLILIGELLTFIRIALKVNFKKAFDDLRDPHSDSDADKKKKLIMYKNLDLLQDDKVEIVPPESVKNGLLTPKDRMIDWESRNSQEYESVKMKNSLKVNENEDEMSEHKIEKLDQLQVLKRKLRNNLKLKKDADTGKKVN